MSTIITDTPDTPLEPIRPIYGPKDARWPVLARWLIENFDRRTGLIDDLTPLERGGWYERCVLGKDLREVAWRSVAAVEVPPFPADVAAPGWATATEDGGIDTLTSYPVAIWTREVETRDGNHPAYIDQEARFAPDSQEVARGPVTLKVGIFGEQLCFTDPAELRRVGAMLTALATPFEDALAGEAEK